MIDVPARPRVDDPQEGVQRYRILDLLGRGGMGDVYKAWDDELEMLVALKALRSSAAHDPLVLARFKQEVKLARRIKHVNVAQVHDLVEQDATRYLAMEYVDGKALNEILAAKGRLPIHVALGILVQVCRGVQAAHDVGVIHRDLKPHNVMLTRRHGRAMILDFGIAREAGAPELTEAGIILGSPQYMSYEQLAGQPVTPRSDLYAIGILLFEMVTGVSPFRVPGASAATLRALREVPPDPRQHEARLPEFVVQAIGRCLAKEPADRFASAEELATFLSRHRAEEPREGALSTTLETTSGELITVGPGPTALVALAESGDRDLIADRLERLGCAVELASDGSAAVDAALRRPYSLIILGARLDRLDGLTACQLLKGNPRLADTHVVVVLGETDPGGEAFARQAGAADVVRAPVNVHALSRTVRRCLTA